MVCAECILTADFLDKNKDIENYDEIKRLNDKYKKMFLSEKDKRLKNVQRQKR